MLSKATLSHLTKLLTPSSRVVLRADFNVPIKEGKVKDPTRILSTIPTINELLKHNPKSLVLLSHLGRPNGKPNEKDSLKPLVPHLEAALKRKVTFLDNCVGQATLSAVSKSQGQIFLCQNVRFHIEEEGSSKDKEGKKTKADLAKVKEFRDQLTQLGQFYVNDAFGAAHRAHSSVVGIAHKVRVAGLLMQKELENIGGFLEKPKKPVLIILGGAKVSDKIQLIKNLMNIADEMIIGGGMASPFLREIFKVNMGNTQVVLPEQPGDLQVIMDLAKAKGIKLHFPTDFVTASEMTESASISVQNRASGISQGSHMFDIGPDSVKTFSEVISRSKSIFWNGPMGVFEIGQFRKGSQGLLNFIVNSTKQNGTTSVIGGGDTVNLVNSLKLGSAVSYVSTGGGASLELLQGKVLPGAKALSQIGELK